MNKLYAEYSSTTCRRTRSYQLIERGGVELLLSPLNDYFFISNIDLIWNVPIGFKLYKFTLRDCVLKDILAWVLFVFAAARGKT
jgi:hypothetical protein